MDKKGFTLIELLIVIAVLGVLATGLVAAINPLEKLANTRDSVRKSTIAQLTQALQEHLISIGRFPYPFNWNTALVDTGSIKSMPPEIPNTPTCNGGVMVNKFCYDSDGVSYTIAILYISIESSTVKSKCISPKVPFYLYSSVDNRVGTVCLRSDQSAWYQSVPSLSGGGYTYLE